jgi:hypothetical protein
MERWLINFRKWRGNGDGDGWEVASCKHQHMTKWMPNIFNDMGLTPLWFPPFM